MGRFKGIKKGSSQPVNNGGILGSGVFGLFGSTVSCKADDPSMYCSFVKFFNLLIMLIISIVIIQFAYYMIKTYFSSSRGGRLR